MISFRNPVLPGFHPDPSICRVGQDYYLVTSTFSYYPGIPIYHSRNLQDWTLINHVLKDDSWVDLDGFGVSDGVWAPTIRHHNGTFHVVFTVAQNRTGKTTYISSSSNPHLRWSTPHDLGAEGIDPSLFFDVDGRSWLTATRDADDPKKTGPAELWLQELDITTLKLVGQRQALWHGALPDTWVEAPHIYLFNNKYWLFGAEGGTERNHAITAAVADKVTGPYVTDPRNPLLTHRHLGQTALVQNVGHADIVDTPDGNLWAVTLGVRPVLGHHTLGRETFLVPVTLEPQGPVLAPGVGMVTGVLPNLPQTDAQPRHWLSLRGPVEYQASGDTITIEPLSVGLHGNHSPAFVAHRQDMHQFVWQCALDTTALEFGSAGLVAFQNSDYFVDIRVTKIGPEYETRVAQTRAGTTQNLGSQRVRGKVTLRISSNGSEYFFGLISEKGAFEILGAVPHSDLSTEATGGFVGVLLGLINQGPESSAPMTFESLKYYSALN